MNAGLLAFRNGLEGIARNLPSIRKTTIFLARAVCALPLAKYFFPDLVSDKVAECANLHLSDVNKQFPFQSWQTDDFSRTYFYACTTEDAQTAAFSNIIDCWKKLDYHKRQLINPAPHTCLMICDGPQTLAAFLVISAIFDTIMERQIDRALRPIRRHPMAANIKWTVLTFSGLANAYLWLGNLMGLPFFQSLIIYGAFRATSELARQVTMYHWRERHIQIIRAQ